MHDDKTDESADLEKISCPCCGGKMNLEKVLENTNLLRCTICGLSDTRTRL